MSARPQAAFYLLRGPRACFRQPSSLHSRSTIFCHAIKFIWLLGWAVGCQDILKFGPYHYEAGHNELCPE